MDRNSGLRTEEHIVQSCIERSTACTKSVTYAEKSETLNSGSLADDLILTLFDLNFLCKIQVKQEQA